jgi:hypothetical protein
MHRCAAGTFRFPSCRPLNRHRHEGPERRVAHELEDQRRAGHASASVAAQTSRSLVAVKYLLAGRTRRLPVARLHDSLVRIVTGTRRCTNAHGDRFPCRAVTRLGTGDGVSNLVQERVENRFLRTVLGIISGGPSVMWTTVRLATGVPSLQATTNAPSKYTLPSRKSCWASR